MSRKHRRPRPDVPAGWERVCAIFGNPAPPRHVWQRQFDGLDADLRRVAAMPLDRIEPGDLWYFLHDLAYVPLQPEVFDYLFPACLMFWRRTLFDGVPCTQGDADFGWSLQHGGALDTMMDEERREDVLVWFRDVMLERIDAERGFDGVEPCHWPLPWGWIGRLNTLGHVAPVVESIWTRWWPFETPGRAVAAVEYVSGLIYFPYEDPLFEELSRRGGTFPVERVDSSVDGPWMEPNAAFLRSTLKPGWVEERLRAAVGRLAGEPEEEKARRVLADLATRPDVLAIGIEDLIEDLCGRGSPEGRLPWRRSGIF
ncbi:hypothetical protein [Paludisphaera sp.]|uniref:hypothetical protein n=1 Tax=Paludisphaera sp. TaxID=2017432 RepID=UPI00301CCFA7